MNLVIVESPKKAELISGFLKKHQLNDYKVMASAGHVRDLKQHSFSVNVEDHFRPEYVITEDKKSLVRELKAAAKKADLVYLASDEDREGEAIAWHLSEALELKPEKTRRIVCHEITAEAFLHALEHPREVNMNLVDAQQARRVLDRIVGFELSPVLWKRIRPSLSAGRVQSVAVRLIVDREREITAFVPQSSYRLQATFVLPSGERLLTELNHRFATEAEAEALMTRCATADFSIGAITRRAARRSPAAPFTTSTLQQEAAHKLGYSVSQTMRLAQSLYESGHITYMRTDSVNLSSQALGAIARQIEKHPGKEYHQPRRFQTKSKGAQEAHEAIRPTYIDREHAGGTAQEQRLYDLIRKRTLASQMADAEIERTTVSIPVAGTDYAFTAQGEVITFRGFLDVYMESTGEEGNAEVTKLLPAVKEHEALSLEALTGEERFTQRPARYTEASMVNKMEELGIGRPSTYAPTIQTIQNRGYVERADREGQRRNYTVLILKDGAVKRAVKSEVYGADKGKLLPTDVGIVVNDFLVDQFPHIADYNFTPRVAWTNNLTYMIKSENKSTGEQLSIIPKYTVNSRLEWKVTDEASVFGTATFYGRQKANKLDYQGLPVQGEEAQGLSPYALVGLGDQLAEALHRPAARGADIAFECTSVQPALDLILDALKPTGKLVIVSIWGKPASLDVQKVVLKELDIRGTIAYVNSHPETIKLVESGKIDLKPFITGKIAVEDLIDKGFDTLIHHNETAVKILVTTDPERLAE